MFQVSFSLRNDSNGKVILQSYRREDIKESLADFYNLKATITLVPIKYVSEGARVSGFISRQLHTDCSVQLVYVNRRIVHKSKVHKLVIDLLKKYGNIWDDMSLDSNDIVDVDGLVFIILIHAPYESYTLQKNGRTNAVEFRDPKMVLKCVHRAVKRVLANDTLSDSNVSIDLNEREIPVVKKSYGPSQLQNVVQGLQVGRPESIPANKTPPVGNTDSLVRYQERFFQEEGDEGTGLAENAPIYEVGDFSLTSFHDFLNWLSLKSIHDRCAQNLIAEYKTYKQNIGNNNLNETVLYSYERGDLCDPSSHARVLKERRKEKFEMRSKIMMGKVLQEVSLKNNLLDEKRGRKMKQPPWTRVVRKETVTVTATPTLNSIPQAAFSDFLSWFNLRANHNNTINCLMRDFMKFKSGYAERTSRVMQLRGPPKENNPVGVKNKQRRVPTRKRVPSEEFIRPSKSRKQKETEKDKNEADGELMLTWASHYASGRNHRPADAASIPSLPRVSQKDLSFPNEPSPPQKKRKSQCASPIMEPDEHNQFSQIEIPSPIEPTRVPQCLTSSFIEPTQVLQVLSPVDLPPIPKQLASHDKEVQVCPTMQDVSTQVKHRKSKKTVYIQTEVQGCNQEVQTEPVAPLLPYDNSSETPLEKIIKPSSSLEVATLPVKVPDHWHSRRTQGDQEFFLHSPSGYTTFDPPASSTHASFQLKNVCERTVENPNPPELHHDGLDELRAAIQDSCQDLLATVKWNEPNTGTLGATTRSKRNRGLNQKL